MEVADKKEMGKGKNEALRLKRCGEEEEEAKEEAPGAPYELENLDSEDDSEDVLSGVVKSMEELGSGERDSQEHGIPKTGIHEKINLMKELAQMSQWTEVQPLRVATGFEYLGKKFVQENGLKHVSILTARGPLEAAPAIGTADVILNLVSRGTILEDSNLKEIEGGTTLESQAVLVASRKSLIQQEDVCDTTREILERLEAHLMAVS